MIAEASRVIAIIPLDRRAGPRGLPPTFDRPFAGSAVSSPPNGSTVLQRTVNRLSRCPGIGRIVILHPADQPPPQVAGQRVVCHATAHPLHDEVHAACVAARKWSPDAWRGGIGGATIFDELLAPAAMLEAMEALGATSALLVGPDWVVVDPDLCAAVIQRHMERPDDLRLVFSQALPGLCGCVTHRSLIEELRDSRRTIGAMLDYHPRAAQGDPIAKDVCVQVEQVVRRPGVRATYDSHRCRAALDKIDPDADAATIARTLEPDYDHPRQVTLELTPQRRAVGPITPQSHQRFDRQPLSLDTARHIFTQLGKIDDLALTLGGLGDALCHPDWRQIIDAARAAGIHGIHIETDLHVDQQTLQQLVTAPVDVISIHLNADEPATYDRLMGGDALHAIMDRIQWLLTHRAGGLPLIVPRMVKTADNVTELEAFVDRWTYFAGHALVEAPSIGGGVVAPTAVMDMAPPRRRPCRQLACRMSILSDGRVALCDEDWGGCESLGNARDQSIEQLWSRLRQRFEQHQQGRYPGMCESCRHWHRP